MRDFAGRDDGLPPLRPGGFQGLEDYWDSLDRIRAALEELTLDATPALRAQLDRSLERIEAFEPSVSILGQVKAGKSTLLNALLGQPGLLPADVNPWTSVITNVHLNSPRRPGDTRALFRFFDADEWERLALTGGRLGEMAARSGFPAEAEQIRAQVMEMRAATEARLGPRFAALLGTSHAFPTLSRDIIDRYICYGDPADAGAEGLYADLTRTADLFLDLPDYPRNLCLRDTPGVNDTFMMREQITINAISESRVCVIVLSAHQALSTMDMALLRIIGNVEARETLIFVNRIDELPDPVAQTRAIEASIRRTLAKAGIGAELTILFGSARWAICALEGRCDALPEAEQRALRDWAGEAAADLPLRAAAYEASGVPALHGAIARRVVEGPGRAMLADVRAEAGNLVSEIETVDRVARGGGRALSAEERATVAARAEAIGQVCAAGLLQRRHETVTALSDRLRRAQDQFLDCAVAGLAAHIAAFGSAEGWQCDPTTLRMMIRSAFLSACKTMRTALAETTGAAGDAYGRLICGELQVPEETVAIHLPQGPMPHAPGIIARTISLDHGQSWWRRFFQRRTPAEERAQRYRAAILAETEPLLAEVEGAAFAAYCDELAACAADFCHRQEEFVRALLRALPEPAPHGGHA